MTDLQSLIPTTRLEGIDVVRCIWERHHSGARGPLAYPARLAQHIQLEVRQPDPMPAGGAAFLVVLQVRWTPEGSSENVAAGEVQIRVVYAFADDTLVLSAEEAKEFGQKVALHNAWPYLRLRLQQLCVELGINPTLLPLKPLPAAPPAPSTEKSTPAER